MDSNTIAKVITRGWIVRCAALGLGSPREPTAADTITIALFVASLGASAITQAQTNPTTLANNPEHGLAETCRKLDQQMDMYERPDLLVCVFNFRSLYPDDELRLGYRSWL